MEECGEIWTVEERNIYTPRVWRIAVHNPIAESAQRRLVSQHL